MDWKSLQSWNFNLVFIGSLLGMAAWETRHALVDLRESPGPRWLSHGLLFVFNTLLLTLLIRVSPLMLAVSLTQASSGLLPQAWIPFPLQFFVALLGLDLTRYCTHRLFHAIAPLWRIHEVHHSDPDYDISTALRFHPLEMAIDQIFLLAAVLLLAPPPAAVFCSEVLATLLNSFVHGNIALAPRWERVISAVFITPGLHRSHHCIDVAAQNTNFGQSFSLWDRLFGTLQPATVLRPTGVSGLPDGAYRSRAALLLAPFQIRPK